MGGNCKGLGGRITPAEKPLVGADQRRACIVGVPSMPLPLKATYQSRSSCLLLYSSSLIMSILSVQECGVLVCALFNAAMLKLLANIPE